MILGFYFLTQKGHVETFSLEWSGLLFREVNEQFQEPTFLSYLTFPPTYSVSSIIPYIPNENEMKRIY